MLVHRISLALLFCCALPSTSFADDTFSFGAQPGWYVLSGVAGGVSNADQFSGHVAGEVSVARLKRGFWVGLYLDGGYDFAKDAALFTAGPEIGWRVLGIDGGLAVSPSDTIDVGAAGRLLLTSGFFALYGRYVFFPESDDLLQIGAMLKFPLWVNR